MYQVSTFRLCARDGGRDREPVDVDAGKEGSKEASHLNQ